MISLLSPDLSPSDLWESAMVYDTEIWRNGRSFYESDAIIFEHNGEWVLQFRSFVISQQPFFELPEIHTSLEEAKLAVKEERESWRFGYRWGMARSVTK